MCALFCILQFPMYILALYLTTHPFSVFKMWQIACHWIAFFQNVFSHSKKITPALLLYRPNVYFSAL